MYVCMYVVCFMCMLTFARMNVYMHLCMRRVSMYRLKKEHNQDGEGGIYLTKPHLCVDLPSVVFFHSLHRFRQGP